MFFYVSFLRPPPTRASLHTPILITPQVANDLRTEPCYVDQDIFYDWILVDNKPPPAKKLVGPSTTRKAATKLMTWKNANAYKEIPVPLPYGVREGQQWRLALSAVPSSSSSSGVPASARIPSSRIYLDEEGIGKWNPLPVSSMPVTFTGNARTVKGAPKQEQIERTYEFSILTSESSSTGESSTVLPSRSSGQELVKQLKGLQVENDTESKVVRLVIREQTSFDLDKKIWDSGIGLSAWLVQVLNNRFSEPKLPLEVRPPEKDDPLDRLKNILISSEPLKILELGAGTGIVALALAALRSRIANATDSILTTDLGKVSSSIDWEFPLIISPTDSAIPLLQHNIDANASTRSSKISLKAGVLDWDEKVSEQLPSSDGDSSIDLVVMADVTYNTSSFPALVRTLADLRNMDPTKRPYFLMGYKERERAERTLWDMVEAVGIKFVQVGSVPGYVPGEEAPIEIWIG